MLAALASACADADPGHPPASPTDSLRTAFEAVVAGEGPGAGADGHSWFDETTRDVLADVRVDSGRAVVSFDPALTALVPGAGSSAGSAVLLDELNRAAFAIGSVDSVEYRLGGSCTAFWEWLQRECTVVRRSAATGGSARATGA